MLGLLGHMLANTVALPMAYKKHDMMQPSRSEHPAFKKAKRALGRAAKKAQVRYVRRKPKGP